MTSSTPQVPSGIPPEQQPPSRDDGPLDGGSLDGGHVYARPRPLVGDASSASERRGAVDGWAMGDEVTEALERVLQGRRDIRRYRPEPVADDLVRRVLAAGHAAPSVGHSQPWRFLVVTDPSTRDRAAHMADRQRLVQAAGLTPDRAARLLDLKLEGIREAPLGIVVACDRRAPAAGVLGRASFVDTDVWSCACAIENMWLTARALGLGMGWVTLFDPDELAALVHLPEGVTSLGWLCLGWPDERPPAPGLERAAWSRRMPLDDVVMHERWDGAATAPVSHLQAPDPAALVAATDAADAAFTTPESLGVLDRAVSRVIAASGDAVTGGTLVLAAADHPVERLGVSAFERRVTADILRASLAGESLGATSARAAGLDLVCVDAGVDAGSAPFPGVRTVAGLAPAAADDEDNDEDGARGDLEGSPAMTRAAAEQCVQAGRALGAELAGRGLVALGEVGIGNTTPAAALACALLHLPPQEVVGLGAGSDAGIVARKTEVVTRALHRAGVGADADPIDLLAELGGPEIAVLTGVVLGTAARHGVVVLDGLATSVAALLAVRLEPGAQAYLVAGQQSREHAHGAVLRELGLEPLLSLRLRAGEGVGACLASSLLLQGLAMRRMVARTE